MRLHRSLALLFTLLWSALSFAQQAKGYEFEKDYPLFLNRIKEDLTYPMAWGNSQTTHFDTWRSEARNTVLEAMLTPQPPAADYAMEVIASQKRNGQKAYRRESNLTD